MSMASKLYNLRQLADFPLRKRTLELFLDTYATSLDISPAVFPGARRRGADALWQDFANISQDANRAMRRHLPDSLRQPEVKWPQLDADRVRLSIDKRMAHGK